MSEQEAWAQGEIVRAVKGLTAAVDRLQQQVVDSVRRIEEEYVSKETLRLTIDPMLAAQRSRATWVRELIAPLMTGLIVTVITIWLRGRGHA